MNIGSLGEWLVLYKLDHGWDLLLGKAACWLEQKYSRLYGGRTVEVISPFLVLRLLDSNLILFQPYKDEPYALGHCRLTEKGKEAYLENYSQ